MTSLKNKNIISKNCKILSLIVVSFAIALACLVATTFVSPKVSYGAGSPTGEVPSSQNFTADGDQPDPYYIPFTFWQKIDAPSGSNPEQTTYTYRLFSVDGNEIPMPGPRGEVTTGTEYFFTLTGDETLTFNIDFESFVPADEAPINIATYKYRSEMITPEPKEGYTYTDADVTFDVNTDVYNIEYAKYADKNTVEIICYEPQTGEKVYDPGWTITYTPPETPPEEETPPPVIPFIPAPQTWDLNWIVAIAGTLIFGVILVLIYIDKRNKKRARQ